MLITKKVKYRGKLIDVKDLKPNTNKKVIVICPVCKKKRETYYKAYLKSKSGKCLKCNNKEKQVKLNKKYGKLRVLEVIDGIAICKCSCGNVVEVPKHNLLKGKTKSCGCIKSKNFINAKPNTKEKHGNWKGGISTKQHIIRNSVKYAKFRKNVFERDNYTCQKCEIVGGELNVHHIIPFAMDEDKIFEIDNGITFCKKCHNRFHKEFGRKCNNKDLIKFIT